VGLQLAALYVPALSRPLKTHPLAAAELAVAVAWASVIFWAVELEKWWKRR
jgi:Ca2+-transporting ATPase